MKGLLSVMLETVVNVHLAYLVRIQHTFTSTGYINPLEIVIILKGLIFLSSVDFLSSESFLYGSVCLWFWFLWTWVVLFRSFSSSSPTSIPGNMSLLLKCIAFYFCPYV